MNKDTIQNIFIGILLGGVILLAGGVYYLAMQVQTATQGIARIEQSVAESMQKTDNAFRCIESGGQYEAGQCVCGSDYFLENGSCMGQDGLTKKQIEEIKANQERIMMERESPAPDSDDAPRLRFGNFAAWIPMDWEARAEAADSGFSRWKLTDAETGTEKGLVTCPTPETGFEGWEFTKTQRSYLQNGVTLHAMKWIGRPVVGSEDLGWFAMVIGGSTDAEAWGGEAGACLMTFTVSSPPTQDELGVIDTIFEMIR